MKRKTCGKRWARPPAPRVVAAFCTLLLLCTAAPALKAFPSFDEQTVTVEIAVAEYASITFPDGSALELNPSFEAPASFDGRYRDSIESEFRVFTNFDYVLSLQAEELIESTEHAGWFYPAAVHTETAARFPYSVYVYRNGDRINEPGDWRAAHGDDSIVAAGGPAATETVFSLHATADPFGSYFIGGDFYSTFETVAVAGEYEGTLTLSVLPD